MGRAAPRQQPQPLCKLLALPVTATDIRSADTRSDISQINYPIRSDLMPVDGLADFVTLCHKHGLKVKL